jgi:predicted ATP-binding protein involved in virulence
LNYILKKLSSNGRVIKGNIIRDNNIIIHQSNWLNSISNYIKKSTEENEYLNGIHSSPRVIFIPSNMTFSYQSKSMLDTTYRFQNIIDTQSLLGNAEFFIKEYVISKERSSLKSNPKERTKDAIDSFNDIFKDSNLITKLIDLDSFNNNRPVFKTLTKEEITIDKLSSGEQQLYARVVALMILNPHNSVILIDEPEIALHPKWQSQIMDIYANIGKNNQFIVATHSPYIIGSVPNKNINFLIKENNKIVAINNIIAYGRDIEWILEQMGIENSRVSDIAKKIEESQKLLDREKYDEAEKLLDTLETIIGSNDSEILAMRNDIAFWRD